MFSMTDAVIGLSILAIVLAGVLTLRSDIASEGEADRASALFVSVHNAAERYLEDRYPHIERCLNGAQWAARWRQRRLDVVNSVVNASEPPNAGNFILFLFIPMTVLDPLLLILGTLVPVLVLIDSRLFLVFPSLARVCRHLPRLASCLLLLVRCVMRLAMMAIIFTPIVTICV